MVEAKQEKATIKKLTPEISDFSTTEKEIYECFKAKGFAVAHIDEHRKLWEWSQKNNCGVYIGRRKVPTDACAGNISSKWANPYKINRQYPADGNRDKVILSFYQHISNKPSLHKQLEKELKGKILFCHCRKNTKNIKSNRCHGDILVALANNCMPFLNTNLSTGSEEFTKLYKDFNFKQIELNL